MIAISLLVLLSGGAAAAPVSVGSRIDALLKQTPLVDGHNDLLLHYLTEDEKGLLPATAYDIGKPTVGQVDLPRLRAGRVGAAIFTVGFMAEADREKGIRDSTGLFRELAARHPKDLTVVTDGAGLRAAFQAGRIAALLGLEGGDQIGGSLALLRAAYRHGVRAMTLTWDDTNDIGDANAGAARFDGLSPFGVEVVREMNRLGMLVDLSHAADATAFDVLELARAPVILSHSNARALCPAPRNVPDALLRRVATNGGIVMVTFVAYFTTREHWAWYERGDAYWAVLMARHGNDRPAARKDMAVWEAENPAPPVRLTDVADHIDHIRKVAGIDHVGLGADFDGMESYRIAGLEDTSRFPALFEELARRGWSDAELRKLAGENFLRVLAAVERQALPTVAP